MDALLNLLHAVPPQFWIPAAVIAATVVALVILEFMARARFKRIIRLSLSSAKGVRLPKISGFALKTHVRWLERMAKNKNIPIMAIFNFREAWLERFKANRSRKNMNRLLDFYPDEAMYPCFVAALEHPGRAKDFLRYLDKATKTEESDGTFFLLKKLALSCGGRQFNADAAWRLLGARIASFREMTGDGEWRVRCFAAAMLLRDNDPISTRVLVDFLADSSAIIRASLVCSFKNEEDPEPRKKFFDTLMGIYLHDPVLAVRIEAKKRLLEDFQDLYRIDHGALDDESTLHVLELLDLSSKEDESLAFSYLDSDDLERRYLAARFLQDSGALNRIAGEADFGDRETLNRTLKRLEHAASVNVNAFLDDAAFSAKSATLYSAASILCTSGKRPLIAKLADHVFKLMGANQTGAESFELYGAALRAIRMRGNEDAARELAGELERRRHAPDFMAILLPELPPDFDYLMLPVLFGFLQEEGFEPKDKLRSAIQSLSHDLVLPGLFDIVKSETRPARVRIEALKILAQLKLPYLMQHILESLPLVPVNEMAVFAEAAAAMNGDIFNKRVATLLSSSDASIRTSIIGALPDSAKKNFIKEIRDSLGDADPDVRIAGLNALAELDETKVINTNAIGLLRDPLERVRNGAAIALGKLGSQESLELMKTLLDDTAEVVSVKKAAIAGLGASSLPVSVDMLVDALEGENALIPELVSSLAKKTERKIIVRVVERFKDATAGVRTHIAAAFSAMGNPGEESLVSLLAEDIASLKPFVCDALEASGYVDSRIKRLNHRDPAIRKAASGDLAAIATGKAFKGIIQASRDPDPEIRVLVTKALEFLNTPEGEPILRELEADPDKRVRKYTAWALERIRAKQMH